MPRYLVERTFDPELSCTCPGARQPGCLPHDTSAGVEWIHSYVSPDRKKSYCVYEAPSPAAVRRASQLNHLPVDRIFEVCLFGPELPSQDGEKGEESWT
jgi:hypothetical protein